MSSQNKIDAEFEEFMAVLPSVVEDITSNIADDMFNLKDHVEELLHYVVPNGKKIRGLIVVAAYRMFEEKEKLTPENIRLAYIMGWVVEIGHAAELIIDDIMDKSDTRRGIPCWHTRNDVGLYGVHDAYFLEKAIYYLIRKHFSHHPNILTFYNFLHDVAWKTGCGQALDCMFTKDGKPDLALFTVDNYKSLVKHKTAYYTFCGPAAVGMYLANVMDEELHKEGRKMLLEVGELFQIQDDFFDCFGDLEDTGKRGEDIREGKCTWLAVNALEKANPEQRKIMEEHYGSTEPEAVEIIHNLYGELGLEQLYEDVEAESFERLESGVQLISEGLPPELFSAIIGKLHRRKF